MTTELAKLNQLMNTIDKRMQTLAKTEKDTKDEALKREYCARRQDLRLILKS